MKNSIKREQSQTGLNSAERENFRTTCKINIEISEEALMRLVESGNCVKGALHRDEWTGKLYFKAYSRKPQIKHKDVLVKKLPWGWVRESLERIKVFGSFPKDMGTASVMRLLEENNRDAKNALIERELDIIEFC